MVSTHSVRLYNESNLKKYSLKNRYFDLAFSNWILIHTFLDQHLQSKCFFFGPMISSVVALQTDLANPWPDKLWRAALILSLMVWPAIVEFYLWARTDWNLVLFKFSEIWLNCDKILFFFCREKQVLADFFTPFKTISTTL